MKTATKLKLCNRWLGGIIFVILLSGIQLETTSSGYVWSVWIHIILGIALTILALYHIYLHYKFTNWFSRFARNRNKATRILWWIFLLSMASGIAATVHWLTAGTHSPLGGIHGKIGFLMVAAAIVHAMRHRPRP